MIGAVLQGAVETGPRVLPDVDLPMWAMLVERLGLSTSLVIVFLWFLWKLGPPLTKAILASARRADRITEQLPNMMRLGDRIATSLERLTTLHDLDRRQKRPVEDDSEVGG